MSTLTYTIQQVPRLDHLAKTWTRRKDLHHFHPAPSGLPYTVIRVVKRLHLTRHGHSSHLLPYVFGLLPVSENKNIKISNFELRCNQRPGTSDTAKTENPECSKTRTFASTGNTDLAPFMAIVSP